MGIGDVLDKIREYYLSRFDQVVHSHIVDAPSTELEPAYRSKHGALAREGPFSLPFRQDLMLVSGGRVIKSIQVDTEKMLSFQPLSFPWGRHLEVRLYPFQWQLCPVVVSPVSAAHSWAPLLEWFMHWFDPEDTQQPDRRGFHGVVHYLEDPSMESHSGKFAVDLGTAPVAAFEGLLDAIEQMQCTEAIIGNTV